MHTQYGNIAIVIENNIKKLDFNNSKFNSISDFIAFLNNKDLTKEILGY